MGDFNGIGPEIVLKALSSPIVKKLCVPVLIGSTEVFEQYARLLHRRITLCEVESPNTSLPGSVIQLISVNRFYIPKTRPGKLSKEAGSYAGQSIERAVKLWSDGVLDGIVTAPVAKEAMQDAGYRFPGQTEMVAALTKQKQFMMMLLAGTFRVGLATIHVPLKKVASLISKKNIFDKLSILNSTLKRDFGIDSPRIAVLGLNPHAGERGKIGMEEIQFIHPAIKQAIISGIDVEGSFPADGFFGSHGYTNYDAVLAMYHDQGLIPLKMQGFDIGVNVTLGLPIVRTSPDHGTAFDIAGKGIANPSSMTEAIKLAAAILTNRKKRRL